MLPPWQLLPKRRCWAPPPLTLLRPLALALPLTPTAPALKPSPQLPPDLLPEPLPPPPEPLLFGRYGAGPEWL